MRHDVIRRSTVVYMTGHHIGLISGTKGLAQDNPTATQTLVEHCPLMRKGAVHAAQND